MPQLIDLTGQKFGRLEVLGRVENDKNRHSRWLCRCNCDDQNKIIALGANLKSGHTESCGCLGMEETIERSTKHGHTKNGKPTGEYQSWENMIQRCTNPKNKQWKDYGGRNIKVCKRWLHSFPNFLEDMGKRPPRCTLERRNNNKGYSKKNCEWVTRKEQNRNKRNNHLITCFGKTQLLIEWSEETGIPDYVIRWRIKHGWTPERALTEPVKKYKKR